MGLWAPRRNDLIAYLQRRLETNRDEGRNWMEDVAVAVKRDKLEREVAAGVAEMEQALQAAGLADGVEPERKR